MDESGVGQLGLTGDWPSRRTRNKQNWAGKNTRRIECNGLHEERDTNVFEKGKVRPEKR